MEKLLVSPKRKHKVCRMVPKDCSIIKVFGKKYIMKNSVKEIYVTIGYSITLVSIFIEMYILYLILYLYI